MSAILDNARLYELQGRKIQEQTLLTRLGLIVSSELDVKKVCRHCKIHEATAHMPRMGSGLAGGNWIAIEQTVQAELASKGVAVTVYDLP